MLRFSFLALTVGAGLCSFSVYGNNVRRCRMADNIVSHPDEKMFASQLTKFLNSRSRALPSIHFEGLLPHQKTYDISNDAVSELPEIRRSIIKWCTGGEQSYYDVAIKKLITWVKVYKYNFNPIDESVFDSFFDAYYAVRNLMPVSQRNLVDKFLKSWAYGYIFRINNARSSGLKGTWENNWQSHRIKIIALIALDLDDFRILNEAERMFRWQIQRNISPEGVTVDFIERDAINYVNYDLDPLLRAAIAASAMGRTGWFDWRSPSGGSLASAVNWLLPYANGSVKHIEYANSSVGIDEIKKKERMYGYNEPYRVEKSADVFWHASLLDHQYRGLAMKLRNNPPDDAYLIGVLNKSRKDKFAFIFKQKR